MPLLSLSPLNVLTHENYPVRKHLQKVVCFILFFIYLRAFNNNVISSDTVNLVTVTTVLLSSVYIAAIKEYLRRIQIILCC